MITSSACNIVRKIDIIEYVYMRHICSIRCNAGASLSQNPNSISALPFEMSPNQERKLIRVDFKFLTWADQVVFTLSLYRTTNASANQSSPIQQPTDVAIRHSPMRSFTPFHHFSCQHLFPSLVQFKLKIIKEMKRFLHCPDQLLWSFLPSEHPPIQTPRKLFEVHLE